MDLLIWAGKVSLYWLFLYGCFHFFLRKLTHFRWNRAYLLASLLLPLALPFIRLPETANTTLAVYAGNLEQFYVIPQQSSSSLNWLQLLGIVYLSGAAFAAARFVQRLLAIRKLWRQAAPVELEDQVELYVFPDDRIRSFSFLNRIAVSNSDYRDHFDAILTHEMVHVRQRHTLDILLIEILRIVFWFHPVLPLYKKSLQEIHEYLADQTTPNRDSYAEFLIAYTFGQPRLTLVNNFYSSSLLKQRIRMLYSDKSSRWKLGFYGITGMLALLLVMVVAACSKDEKEEVLKSSALSTADPEKIFTAVETNPEFPGGTDALYQYLAENIKYPEAARKAKVGGRVFLKFVVRTDGSVNDVRVVKGLGFGCDQEAVRVVKNMPKWEPGKQSGRPVNVEYILPIAFLQEENSIPSIQLANPLSGAAETKPLFILEGKEVSGPNQIKPDDIESISVLKGAEAVKAYGEKGKNGVVEITTKKKLQLHN